MEIYVDCEDCNSNLMIMQEWTDSSGMNVTVRGCDTLLKLLGQCYQVMQSECKHAEDFLEEIDTELYRHNAQDYKYLE